uniref:CCHC-type domain-containing protein n=1 Tax=Nothobranchius furzeri TaxID=105023 RepID=A0A8C6LIY6_NOTFU
MSWVRHLHHNMTESSSHSSNLSTESVPSVSATLAQHSNSLHSLSDQLSHTNQTLFELGTMVKELSHPLTSPEQASSPAPSLLGPVLPAPSDLPCFRVATSPPPEIFDGNREVCRGFLLQCQLAFQRSPESFYTDDIKISHIIGLLRGKALRWAEVKSRNPSFLKSSLDEFLADFKMPFDKPESAADVVRQIWSLRQGKLSIAEFSIEFRTLAATSTLDEASLKGAFTQALNEQLQDQLDFCQEPPDLESLITLCSRMERRHKARPRGNHFPLPSRFNYPRHVNSAAPALPPSEPIQIGRARLTQEERNMRMSTGACLYCGMSGHFVANCPKQLKLQDPSAAPRVLVGGSRSDLNSRCVLDCSLSHNQITLPSLALIDSGCELNLLDQQLVEQLRVFTLPLQTPCRVSSLDGGSLISITHKTAPICLMTSGNHSEELTFFVFPSPQSPVVPGHPWLRNHNPRFNYKSLRNTLNKEIRPAKIKYAAKLKNQFTANNPTLLWRNIQHITNYRRPSSISDANHGLAEELNGFYCRFEERNVTPLLHSSIAAAATPHLDTLTPLSSKSQAAFLVKEEDVCNIFRRQNVRKAPGPDGVTPSCLRTCAVQLAPVFTTIFNRSLELCEVPSCFKSSTIIPVPKKSSPTELNDYRPVALTSVVMKSFERLVLSHLKSTTGHQLDPLQFAYRANRSVDDAINMGLHFILEHLDQPRTYARILFVDFSSAFNTVIPEILTSKLSQLTVSLLCVSGFPAS